MVLDDERRCLKSSGKPFHEVYTEELTRIRVVRDSNPMQPWCKDNKTEVGISYKKIIAEAVSGKDDISTETYSFFWKDCVSRH